MAAELANIHVLHMRSSVTMNIELSPTAIFLNFPMWVPIWECLKLQCGFLNARQTLPVKKLLSHQNSQFYILQ